ncbi:MAG TPA: sulfite exporter TauE/SafE family protein, partial [Actinobacteria bacterium]|nr:sulfite exporter TauE/SafE family protein [Actinomycetota bacterium]
MSRTLLAALVGITAGVTSGLFGIGGGLVFVPGLVLILGFEQHRA